MAPQVEHLKLIQAVVSRLAGNSFLLKGWTVTLVAGLSALAKADTDRAFAWIACGVIVVFGLLDAYYLALERKFRVLYDSAVACSTADWSLAAGRATPGDVLKAIGSFALWPFYLVAAIGAVLTALSI